MPSILHLSRLMRHRALECVSKCCASTVQWLPRHRPTINCKPKLYLAFANSVDQIDCHVTKEVKESRLTQAVRVGCEFGTVSQFGAHVKSIIANFQILALERYPAPSR